MYYQENCLVMKKMKSTDELLNAALNSRIEIQDRSLQSYSKEIFENIGQVLSLVKLQLLNLRNDDQKLDKKITDTGRLLNKAITDLRDLTKQVSPDEVIKKGFAYAINYELERLNKAGLCEMSFLEEGEYKKFDDVSELVIFCVLQNLIYPLLDLHDPGTIKIKIQHNLSITNILICRKYKGETLYLDIESMALLKQKLKAVKSDIVYQGKNFENLVITLNK